MAKLKVKLRPSTIKGKAGTIFYYLSHKKVVRQITTNIHLHPKDWDEDSCCVNPSFAECQHIQNRIDADLTTIRKIIRDLEISGVDFRTEDIVSRFKEPIHHVSVLDFFQEQINFLTDCHRLGTAQNYRRTLDSLNTFLDGKILLFSEITSQFVDSYNDFLLRRGLVKNSISFYMRILRALYNKAVRRGYVEQSYPFKDVYTGIDRTRKRAINKTIVLRLIDLEIPDNSSLDLARDLFLFSLYTRGMAFVDMAYLTKSNIVNNNIQYSRHKTGQSLTIKIEPCIASIIEKYAASVRDSPFIFPILAGTNPQENFKQYKSKLRSYNSQLKQLALKLGIGSHFSSYTSRHSWASIARDQNIPISVISAGMGHSSERTTRIYLTSLENSIIDGANKELLDSFNPLSLNKKGFLSNANIEHIFCSSNTEKHYYEILTKLEIYIKI